MGGTPLAPTSESNDVPSPGLVVEAIIVGLDVLAVVPRTVLVLGG
jgi:hypothetical protein